MVFAKKNVMLYLSLVFFLWGLYSFVQLYRSSVQLENKKALFQLDNDRDGHVFFDFLRKEDYDSMHPLLVSTSPAEIDLHLRYYLLNHESQSYLINELDDFYKMLIGVRPSWPYYYSGMAQLAMLYDQVDELSLMSLNQYGYHETKVVESLSEILFYSWNNLQIETRQQLLTQLIDQKESLITSVVNISAKFAKIYHICDFIYEKKQVEYPACKDQYWQPLKRL